MSSQANRQELDPPAAPVPPPVGIPAEEPSTRRADDPEIASAIDGLIASVGGEPGSFESKLVRDVLVTGLKLIPDGRNTGELKLISAAIRELRYAYRVFGAYPEPHKVSIFGSARTPADHPDYAAASEFGRLMGEASWMVITGAGGGIMEAGHVGPGRERSFGVAIRLPFEQTTNPVIAGDEKLIHFRYFFTRKLMFLSQSEAVALFPGGFGTMDEAFEALTLIQTGKSSMIPIVLCEGKGQNYWEQFHEAMRVLLLERGWISPEDLNLYTLCKTPAAARDVILKFYRNYHSSRYVRDDLVIRLRKPIHQKDVDRLAAEFSVLIRPAEDGSRKMVLRGPYEVEEDHLDLPRLCFTHTRHKFGMVRRLIDRINECEVA
ncbi:MAG: LOG family protein [Phycisphaeraceae bacterium]|nr:LOG family protein [Phycisphaeraceae bacterium]